MLRRRRIPNDVPQLHRRLIGPGGDTRWNQHRLQATLPRFTHHEIDVRERARVLDLVERVRPDAIVHTAAQPSHDLAARIPSFVSEAAQLGEAARVGACNTCIVEYGDGFAVVTNFEM